MSTSYTQPIQPLMMSHAATVHVIHARRESHVFQNGCFLVGCHVLNYFENIIV